MYDKNVAKSYLCQGEDVDMLFHYYFSFQGTHAEEIKELNILPSDMLTNVISYPLFIEKLKQIYYHQINISNLTN